MYENSDTATKEIIDDYIKVTRTIVTYQTKEDRIAEILMKDAQDAINWNTADTQKTEIEAERSAFASELSDLGYVAE